MVSTPQVKRTRKRPSEGRLFHLFNYTLLSVWTMACLFPFLNTFASAFSENHAIQSGKVSLYPIGFQLDAMRTVAMDSAVQRSLLVTVFVAVLGTALNMLFTIITAYPLSRRDLRGRGLMMNYILVTMVFSGGMIPSYLLVKELGLLNNLMGIILPGLISSFNMIVMKTFFQNMPEELREAAVMDGCSNVRYIARIAVPLSMPAIVTVSLFYAVHHWNNYFAPLLYLDNPNLHTLQIKLRSILLLSQINFDFIEGTAGMQENELSVIQESLKAATIVFATVPILLVYPWLQKYFVKGAMIGSVKG